MARLLSLANDSSVDHTVTVQERCLFPLSSHTAAGSERRWSHSNYRIASGDIDSAGDGWDAGRGSRASINQLGTSLRTDRKSCRDHVTGG